MKKRIVVIEDDLDVAQSIRYSLERHGEFQVLVKPTGEEGLECVLEDPPSLVLLDVRLPSMDGFELCRMLRLDQATAYLPIIMLTACTHENQRIHGLNLGADDYIIKPFSLRELAARIAAVLRRCEGESPTPVYDDGTLYIDYEHFIVRSVGKDIPLTKKEYGLLKILVRNKGCAVKRHYLLDHLWGIESSGETRSLDVHIRRLRQKLGNEHYIETVVGVGYRFVELQRSSSAAFLLCH